MSTIRLILAVFIGAGLILAPIQAARLMPLHANASIEMTMQATPSSGQDCACCKLAARCVMATCALSCPQFIQISSAPNDFAIVGHAAFAAVPPPYLEGLGLRPPVPPPRT